MAVNKRLLQGAAAAPGGLTPSEHFGVVLYEGDGSSSHSINGGKFGAGGYFTDSNSSYISRDSGFLPMGNAARTFSFWVMVNSHSTDQYFLSYGDGANGEFFSPRIRPTSQGGYISFMGYAADLDSNVAMTTGEWMHLCYTYDGTTLKIYKNATEIASGSLSLNTSTARDFTIGARDLDGTRSKHMNGKLDQLRIFTKALSSSEVSTLYAETAATVESLDPLSEDTTDTLQVLGDSSCIATYRFENNEDDLSGNYNGTGTAIQYAAGRYGQAASFNGSSSYINPNGDWGVNGDSSHSVSFWVNFNSSSGPQHFYGIGDTVTAFTHTSLYIDSGLNTVVHDNNGSADNLATSLGLSTGQWYHFVLTYNSSDDGLEFYLDGVSKGTATRTLNVTGDAVIGRRPYYATNYLNANLDQFRVFNKELSASEVTTLYQENSLVASYRFEGNANDDMRAYDGTASNVTYEYGLNFTPDLVWIKERSAAESHRLFDSSRGPNKRIFPDTTSAESTATDSLQSFDTGGFSLGSSAAVNQNGEDYVAWCWKANGGTTSTNTDGEITTTVQANQDAGFSIVTFDGITDPGEKRSFGHGLSQEPEFIWMKRRNAAQHNAVFAKINGTWEYFDGTSSTDGGGDYSANITTTSTVVDIYDAAEWFADPSSQYVYWLWHSVDSFSKFGSYTGTGAAGNLIETEFEPAYIMIKRVDTTSGWLIFDNKRNPANPRNSRLEANNNQAEQAGSTSKFVDFYSNGFEPQVSDSEINASGGTYLYMAFAADPDTEAPTLASSFDVSTYTGNATNNSVDIGFDAGLTWIKNRTDAGSYHILFDKVRGLNQVIHSNLTNAEQGSSNNFEYNDGTLSFDGSTTWGNKSGSDYVAWAWKADDNEPTIFGGAAKAVYKFEDNGNDVTGSWNATPTSITYGTGKFNKGAIFNGTSSKFTTSSSFNGTNGGSFSLSLWVKFDDVSTNENVILGRFSYTTSDKQFILRLTSSSTWRISVYNSSGSGESMTTTETASTDTWYHLVVVVDGTKKSIYVDGVLLKSETGSISPNSSATGALEIGGSRHLPDPDNNGDRLEGMMDQLRIFNAALTDVQVEALYAETANDNDNVTLGGPPETIISANANAGFSIVKYEGNGVAGTKVSHGLSAAPEMIIVKNLSSSTAWAVFHTSIGATKYLSINETTAVQTATNVWNDTAPNSTTFTVGTWSPVNNNGDEHIAYCFHSVSGYSKIGSYSGGSTGSGNVITTGFQPDWIIIKRTDTADDWTIIDSVRGDGGSSRRLIANTAEAEKTATSIWYPTSTGFYFESTGNSINASGGTYIYMAFKIN